MHKSSVHLWSLRFFLIEAGFTQASHSALYFFSKAEVIQASQTDINASRKEIGKPYVALRLKPIKQSIGHCRADWLRAVFEYCISLCMRAPNKITILGREKQLVPTHYAKRERQYARSFLPHFDSVNSADKPDHLRNTFREYENEVGSREMEISSASRIFWLLKSIIFHAFATIRKNDANPRNNCVLQSRHHNISDWSPNYYWDWSWSLLLKQVEYRTTLTRDQ
mgnify:FL=1